MNDEDVKHIIIKTKDVDKVDWSSVVQSGPGALDVSYSGNTCILSYKGEQPLFVYNITNDTVGLPEYTSIELTKQKHTEDWSGRKRTMKKAFYMRRKLR